MPATTLATTAAITAVTTMNKTIQAKSESMGAKHILNQQELLVVNTIIIQLERNPKFKS